MIKSGLFLPETNLLNAFWERRFLKAYQEAVSKKKGLWQIWKWKDSFAKEQKRGSLSYKNQKKVSVMTYNLENLFDAQKNSKRDDTYLPIQLKQSKSHKAKCNKIKGRHYKKDCLELDWSEGRYREKLKRISQVILNTAKNTKVPDILLLEEMENYNVLKEMVGTYLKSLKYHIYHIESRDFRGIDLSVFSRLKLAQVPKYHEIKFSRYRATRGLLETTFFLPNRELLTTFVLHFPSQRSKTKGRAEALIFLDQLKVSLPKNRYVVAGGDCNIIKIEEPELYSNYLKTWKISHQVGCEDCQGTYYYPPKKSWSFFDVFYYSDNLSTSSSSSSTTSSAWSVDTESIRIINDVPLQNNSDHTPKAFESENEPGISDHWPLYMEMKLDTIQKED